MWRVHWSADNGARRIGHWGNIKTLGGWYVRCSECKHNFDPMTGAKHYKYCPYCGAKMEEKDG